MAENLEEAVCGRSLNAKEKTDGFADCCCERGGRAWLEVDHAGLRALQSCAGAHDDRVKSETVAMAAHEGAAMPAVEEAAEEATGAAADFEAATARDRTSVRMGENASREAVGAV